MLLYSKCYACHREIESAHLYTIKGKVDDAYKTLFTTDLSMIEILKRTKPTYLTKNSFSLCRYSSGCVSAFDKYREEKLTKALNGRSTDELVWIFCDDKKWWQQAHHFHDTTDTFVKTIIQHCICSSDIYFCPHELRQTYIEKHQCVLKEVITVDRCNCQPIPKSDSINLNFHFYSGKHIGNGWLSSRNKW